MGWSSKYICLGLPSICICVEAKALSGRSTTGLMGESQNPLAGLRGWKLYKDPFISFGGNPVTPPGGDRYDWTSQKNILKHLLQLRRYDRYGCKFKGNPCRLHTETWEGGRETWRMFIFWWWSMQMKLVLKHEHVTPKKQKMGGEKRNFRERVCVCVKFGFLENKSNPPMRTSNSLPWIHELFKRKVLPSGFLEKQTSSSQKSPMTHPWDSRFVFTYLKSHKKIQRNPWIGKYYLTRPMGIRFWEQRWFGDLFGVRLRLDDFCWEILKVKCLERILETSWNEIEGKDM